MKDPKDSRAARSSETENTAKRERAHKGDLEAGLEDGSPASDRGAGTRSTVSAGRSNADEADRLRQWPKTDDGSPLVEEALRSTGENRRAGGTADAGIASLQTLRRDADRIAETAAEVASGATSLAKSEARSFLRDVEGRIREHPITAVAIVAALAFVYGATR